MTELELCAFESPSILFCLCSGVTTCFTSVVLWFVLFSQLPAGAACVAVTGVLGFVRLDLLWELV